MNYKSNQIIHHITPHYVREVEELPVFFPYVNNRKLFHLCDLNNCNVIYLNKVYDLILHISHKLAISCHKIIVSVCSR